MHIFQRIDEARSFCSRARSGGTDIGFVPTMGAFHEGHISLIRSCREENETVMVSIFVNPAQFGPDEDFVAYPRDLDYDAGLCREMGVDAVFAPSVAEMYPTPQTLSLDFGGLTSDLEGRHRPGHFAGVGLVIAKLFNVVGACRAYFGDKDWQQLAVVRRLTAELAFPVEVLGCETVRDSDGLALSSRNAYLSATERQSALGLYRSLRVGSDKIESGERSRDAVEEAMALVLAEVKGLSPDYAVVRDAATLMPVDFLSGDLRLLVAANVGGTRLIDNLGARADRPPPLSTLGEGVRA